MITSLPSFEVGPLNQTTGQEAPSENRDDAFSGTTYETAEEEDTGFFDIIPFYHERTNTMSLPLPQEHEFRENFGRRRAKTVPNSTLQRQRRNVTFSNTLPEIDFVSLDEEARTSRAGSWGVAPFHDQYWDGEKGAFREFPISEHELRQENIRHEILSFFSQTLFGIKSLLGMKSGDKKRRKRRTTLNEKEENCADLDPLIQGLKNSMLRLLGPSR